MELTCSDIGLAEPVGDGFPEDEGGDAGRHRDAHGHKQQSLKY